MARRQQLNVRIDDATVWRLEQLSRRLSIPEASLVRLAIARLAQLEGIGDPPEEVDLGGAAA